MLSLIASLEMKSGEYFIMSSSNAFLVDLHTKNIEPQKIWIDFVLAPFVSDYKV